MSRLIVAVVFAMALAMASGTVAAKTVHFHGSHPVAPKVAKGMCHIEGPHIHNYGPHKRVLYIKVEGGWSFVGDPTAYVVDKEAHPRHAYYGHHPLFWHEADIGRHYCYISGPHYHWYEPPDELAFEVKGHAYWWVGKHPRWYRRRRHKRLDRYYRTEVHLVRPRVTVRPPSGFVGVYFGPGGVRTAAGVAAPGVHIDLPVPTVDIHVGSGARHHRTHVVHHRKRKRPRGWAWGHHGKAPGKKHKVKYTVRGPKGHKLKKHKKHKRKR